MNLTNEHHFEINEEVFVPFWVVLQFIDVAPPTPFIKCRILTIDKSTLQSPSGPVIYDACTLELGKQGLIADGIPLTYIIPQHKLEHWANIISAWFAEYPNSIMNASSCEE